MAMKKIEPITSLVKDEDRLVVQKSKPLFALWQSELTLAEFKILDTYLGRINSYEPEKRVVVFEKGELEKILDVQKISNKHLEERLKHLMGNVVKIPDGDETKGFKLITLFEEAVAEQDEYGVWKVKLECTQKAMKYIFNIENLGYCRYKLRCITSITSRYTYVMFVYLESCRTFKTWEIPLAELKKILNCDKEETYKEYKHFNNLILKKTHKELNEKTECRYTYEPIKKGRSVVAVRFTIQTLPKNYFDDIDIAELEEKQERDVDFYLEPLNLFNFSDEELDEIKSIMIEIPENKLPSISTAYGSVDILKYHYLDQKAKEIVRRDKEKSIKNKFAYLKKIIKEDCK